MNKNIPITNRQVKYATCVYDFERDGVTDFTDTAPKETSALSNQCTIVSVMVEFLIAPVTVGGAGFTYITSTGTTGFPKSVPLTHNNIVQNFIGIRDIIPITSDDVSLSFLPLAHIFERTVGFFCVFGVGAQIYYAQSIDTVANDFLNRSNKLNTENLKYPKLINPIFGD